MTTSANDPALIADTDIRRPGREALAMFLGNLSSVIGILLLAVIVLTSLLGPAILARDPFEMVSAPFMPPDAEFWFGTDYLGRDVFIGVVHGGRVTLTVGAIAAVISVMIGITMGALSGYYGGRVESLVLRITEFFQILPALLLAMVFITLFSPSLTTIIVAIAIVSWPAMARLTRAEFLRLKQMEYVRAARAINSSDMRIMLRVILPNALPPLTVMAALNTGVAILFEAGLSFLGLGDPSQMSWGQMIGSNRDHILSAWWPVTLPGIAIFLTVLSISLIGDGLNDAFNPKLRER